MGVHGAEIGYWSHPAARGRGVMTEAVGLLTRHVFLDTEDGGLGAHRLFIRAAVDNLASRHVAEAQGYQRCGLERHANPMGDGSYSDLVAYDMTRADWVSRQQ
jgi:RimJ/RimL family protein N-acetyltransferase